MGNIKFSESQFNRRMTKEKKKMESSTKNQKMNARETQQEKCYRERLVSGKICQ